MLSIFPARMNLHFQIIASIQHNHLYIIYAVKGAQHPVTLSFHDMSQNGGFNSLWNCVYRQIDVFTSEVQRV